MSEEELYLFQLSTIDMAEFCVFPPEIMGIEMIQLHPLCVSSN